jgi:CBS domain-containing protein
MAFPTVTDPTRQHYLELPVRELMTPGVVCLPDNATVRMAFGALVTHRVHAVLVVDHVHGRPLGWVSARALMPYLLRDDDLLLVRLAIDEPAETISPGASARDALDRLTAGVVTHLLVARGPESHPEGVISALDLMGIGVR